MLKPVAVSSRRAGFTAGSPGPVPWPAARAVHSKARRNGFSEKHELVCVSVCLPHKIMSFKNVY